MKIEIDSQRIVRNLWRTCRILGTERGYGMEEKNLGTKSIRSRAAMSLFLMDHSVEKIMILGRWSANAFMVYI